MAQSTRNYKKFNLLDGNRRVYPGHVKTLVRAIAAQPELLATRPILVNENYEVIDGQHRLEAAKQLGVPIYYEIGKDLDVASAISLNQYQRNWKLIDYARSYAEQGRPAYQRLMELAELYPRLDFGTLLVFFTGRPSGGGRSQTVRSGKLKSVSANTVIEQQLDLMLDLAAVVPDLKTPTPAGALMRIMQSENYDHERMLDKLSRYGETHFKSTKSVADGMRNLEEIYNFNSKTDHVRLF